MSSISPASWTRFAATGDPNGEGDPLWPPYEVSGSNSDALVLLDVAAGEANAANVTVVQGFRKPACDLWAELNPKSSES